jgi:DNA-binding protein H-NS
MAIKKESLKSLSRADLIKERDRLEEERQRIDAEIAAQEKDQLKSLVDAFKVHLKENDFSLEDAIVLLSGTKARAKRETAAPKITGYEKDVAYNNPNGDQTWVGGTKGPKPKWLIELLSSGHDFKSLAVKK